MPPLIPFLTVCLCSFYILHYLLQEGLEVGCKPRRPADQADIENWIFSPSSHLLQEISPKPKSLSAKYLKPLISMEKVKCLNTASCRAYLYWR